jgi:hypothetical protein
MHEPLGFLFGQMLFVLQPTLAPFLGNTSLHDYALLLEDRGNIERLANLLADEEGEHTVSIDGSGKA